MAENIEAQHLYIREEPSDVVSANGFEAPRTSLCFFVRLDPNRIREHTLLTDDGDHLVHTDLSKNHPHTVRPRDHVTYRHATETDVKTLIEGLKNTHSNESARFLLEAIIARDQLETHLFPADQRKFYRAFFDVLGIKPKKS